VCTVSVSPTQSLSASPLSPVRGFPALRVLRTSPTSTIAFASLRMVRSVGILDPPTARPRRQWISQVLNASVSGRAVLSDPAAVSGPHRLSRWPTVAFQVFDPVGLRMSTHEAQSLHLRYGLPLALPTLSPCRCLHEPKARFPVGRLFPLAGAGIPPAGSAKLGLARRSESRKSAARIFARIARDSSSSASLVTPSGLAPKNKIVACLDWDDRGPKRGMSAGFTFTKCGAAGDKELGAFDVVSVRRWARTPSAAS